MENNTKREPLRLVDGKFMRGGFVVAPVIGDREQIALLQAEERAAEERDGVQSVANSRSMSK